MKLDIFNTDGSKSIESLAVKCKLLNDYTTALKDKNHKIYVIDKIGYRAIDVFLGDLVVRFTDRLDIEWMQVKSRYYASSSLELRSNFLDILDDVVVKGIDTEVFELEDRTVYCNRKEGLVLIARKDTLLALYNIGVRVNDIKLEGGILRVCSGALLIRINTTDYSTVADYNINPLHHAETVKNSLFKVSSMLNGK